MTTFSLTTGAASRIAGDAYLRSTTICSTLRRNTWALLTLLPAVSGQETGGYTNLNGSDPTYSDFVAGGVDNTTGDGDKVLADVNNFMATSLDYASWRARAEQIRSSGNEAFCIGNLSIALNGVGAAYQAGSSGATTLLTLLPTAGALIGTPAKELWVLYKLVPLAGVLSMMLSLGGNIVPTQVNEYERVDSFSYQGKPLRCSGRCIANRSTRHDGYELRRTASRTYRRR